MSLVITGASGQLGRRTAELLLDTDGIEAADVVLVSRSTEKLADLVGRGAQIRTGDFSDPGSLTDAFEGATRVLIISTNARGEERVAQHRAAIDAAAVAGAQLIAYTSVLNPDPEANPAFVVPDHAATERAILDSGVPHAFLRNALYADFLVPEAERAVADGAYRFNTADGATSYVAREDCAAAAAAVLAGGVDSSGQAYDITGPEALSGADLAACFASVAGRAVEPVAVDDADFVAGLVGAGWPEPGAQAFASFGQAIRAGAMEQISGDVERLIGRRPRDLGQVLRTAVTAERG